MSDDENFDQAKWRFVLITVIIFSKASIFAYDSKGDKYFRHLKLVACLTRPEHIKS